MTINVQCPCGSVRTIYINHTAGTMTAKCGQCGSVS